MAHLKSNELYVTLYFFETLGRFQIHILNNMHKGLFPNEITITADVCYNIKLDDDTSGKHIYLVDEFGSSIQWRTLVYAR